MSTSEYYKSARHESIASQISWYIRKKIYKKFMDEYQPGPQTRILDIGVTSDDHFNESNFFEKMYPYKDKLVCVGVEDAGYLERKYPGITFIRIDPNQRLPFENQEFDIAFSNAVIEHVGSNQRQRFFIEEMVRVSKSFFITTPNRWFPIELHTTIPLLHYLPPRLYRKTLSAFGEHFWSKEENLNLLSIGQMKGLFPKNVRVTIGTVRFLGISTNILAYKKREYSNDKFFERST